MHIFSILNVCVTFVGNIFFAPIDFFFLVKLMKNDEFPLFLPPPKIMCYIWQRFIFVFITVVQSLVYKMNTLKSIWLDIIFGIKL